MATATMTSKGQTVIPKEIRDFLGLHSGDRVDFVVQDRHSVLLRPATVDVRSLKGALHKPGRRPVELAAMQRAIAARGGRMP